MCGGAILSDFISASSSRKLSGKELWSELDTDLLGLDSNTSEDQTSQFKSFHIVLKPVKPNRVNPEKPSRVEATEEEEKKKQRTRKNVYRGIRQRPWGKWVF